MNSAILIIPDIIHYITIFLDLPAVLNLAQTCKTIYHIITVDSRFTFIKIIYITLYTDYDSIFADWLPFIKTNRYNYYKLIQSNQLLYALDFPWAVNKKEYYRQIHQDPVVIAPKYFNELYTDNYYNIKYDTESYNKIIWYELGLDKLIQYYKTYNKSYKFAADEPLNLSLKTLIKFEHTNFTKNLRILVTNYEGVFHILKFKYYNMIGTVDKINEHGADYVIIIINNDVFKWQTRSNKLIKLLQTYLQKNMQLNNAETELFADFIVELLKKP